MGKVEFEGRVLSERFLLRKVDGDVFEVKDLEGELEELLYGLSFQYQVYRCKVGSRNYLLFKDVSNRAIFVIESREILSYYAWLGDFMKCVVNGEEFYVGLRDPNYENGWWEITQGGYWLEVGGYVSYPEIRFVMHGEKLTPICLVSFRTKGDLLYLFEYRTLYEGDKIFVDSGFNSLNVIRNEEGNVEGISILPTGVENSVFRAPESVYAKVFDSCKFHRAGDRRVVISLEGGRPLVDYSEYLRYLNQEEFSFTLVAEREDGFYISSDFKHWIKLPAEAASGKIIFKDGWVDLKHHFCMNIV